MDRDMIAIALIDDRIVSNSIFREIARIFHVLIVSSLMNQCFMLSGINM